MVHLQFMLPDCVLSLVCCLVLCAAWCRLLPRPQASPPWLPSWLRAPDGCWLHLMATDGLQAPDGDCPAGFPCQHLFSSLASVSGPLPFWCFWHLLPSGPSPWSADTRKGGMIISNHSPVFAHSCMFFYITPSFPPKVIR